MEPKTRKTLSSVGMIILAVVSFLAGVSIIIDAVNDSVVQQETTAVPTDAPMKTSPPSDSSIGQEAGPYR